MLCSVSAPRIHYLGVQSRVAAEAAVAATTTTWEFTLTNGGRWSTAVDDDQDEGVEAADGRRGHFLYAMQHKKKKKGQALIEEKYPRGGRCS